MKVSVQTLVVIASFLAVPAYSALPANLSRTPEQNAGVDAALQRFLKKREGAPKVHDIRALNFKGADDVSATHLTALVKELKTLQSEISQKWPEARETERNQLKARIHQIFKVLDRIANRVKVKVEGEDKLKLLQLADENEFPIVRDIREIAYETLKLSLVEGTGDNAGLFSLNPDVITRFDGAKTGADGLKSSELRDWASMAYRLLGKEQRKKLKDVIRYDLKRKKLLYPEETFAQE